MMIFHVLLVASQVVAVVMLGLAGYWTGNTLGGFAWDGSMKEFNYHPLFMTIGLIFLYGEAILFFRVFRNVEKRAVKLVHAALHTAALIFACVSLKAVFVFHRVQGFPDMYSFHSWVGIVAFILFALQWLAGTLSFLYPKLPDQARAAYLPLHRYVGVATFAAVIAAASIGINEKLFFTYSGQNDSTPYSRLPSGALVGNFFGFFVVLFGLIVGYLVTNPAYQRAGSYEPKTDETALRESSDTKS